MFEGRFDELTRAQVIDEVLEHGACQDIGELPEHLARQVAGIGDGRPTAFSAEWVVSLSDGAALTLANHVAETEGAELERSVPMSLFPMRLGDLCPDCCAAVAGCRKCYSCGHMEC